MKKTVLFSNIYPYYAKAFWTLLVERIENILIGFQFHDNRGIKLVDIESSYSKEYQNKFFVLKNILIKNKHLVYQFGVISRCITWNIDKAIFLGDAKVFSTWIASLICRIRGIEVIYWTHGFYGKENFIKLIIRKLFYSLANKFIVYERRGKKLMVEAGFKKDNIYVIFNSLDYELNKKIYSTLDSNNRASVLKFFSDPDKPLITFIGRLTPQKKLNLLIEAVNEINKKSYKLNLLIIGDGNERDKLEKIAVKGLNKKQIHFYGELYEDEVAGELLFHSNLCVSPGNVGLTAIHSLSFGTPVLTHDNFDNQMPEVQAIENGVNGGFFIENNLTDLIRQICRLVLSNKKIEKAECIKVIADLYNPYYMLDTFKQLLTNKEPRI